MILDDDTYMGLAVENGDATYFTSRNNRFRHNSVTVGAGLPYLWRFARRTAAEWAAYGHN